VAAWPALVDVVAAILRIRDRLLMGVIDPLRSFATVALRASEWYPHRCAALLPGGSE